MCFCFALETINSVLINIGILLLQTHCPDCGLFCVCFAPHVFAVTQFLLSDCVHVIQVCLVI